MSITSHKTPQVILNEVLMTPRNNNDICFFVEGPSDSKFWKRYLVRSHSRVFLCEGRPNLLSAMLLMINKGIPNVTGVYDTDYDVLQNIAVYHSTHLTRTDHNDLEITFVTSNALKILLDEFADADQIIEFEKRVNMTILNHIEKVSCEFGKLRYLNLIRNLEVKFDNLSPYRFVSKTDWGLDLAALRTAFCSVANLSEMDLINNLMQYCPDQLMWAYSQGHDTLKILAIGLRYIIGNHQRDEDGLLGELRLAFSKQMLEQTAMYASLKTKETRWGIPLFA